MGLDEAGRVVAAQGVVAFVTARLDEDERWAQGVYGDFTRHHGAAELVEELRVSVGLSSAVTFAAHVLREVAAMRAIVARYECAVRNVDYAQNYPGVRERFKFAADALRGAVENLAAIWSEHADYEAHAFPHGR